MKQLRYQYLFSAAAMFAASSLLAHQGQHHHAVTAAEQPALADINRDYLERVKPIFVRCCFDCHSTQTNYPWYSSLPFAKGLIAGDIAGALEHLDLTPGFPFKGHASPREDLEAIQKEIEEGEMPPLRYRILHPGSGVTKAERAIVNDWVAKSLAVLK